MTAWNEQSPVDCLEWLDSSLRCFGMIFRLTIVTVLTAKCSQSERYNLFVYQQVKKRTNYILFLLFYNIRSARAKSYLFKE